MYSSDVVSRIPLLSGILYYISSFVLKGIHLRHTKIYRMLGMCLKCAVQLYHFYGEYNYFMGKLDYQLKQSTETGKVSRIFLFPFVLCVSPFLGIVAKKDDNSVASDSKATRANADTPCLKGRSV
uniref:Uncharacterized protein n=1 Tax=Glossina austeni TaxID=7395 RepID=A0A1A9UPQ9_GLOAU